MIRIIKHLNYITVEPFIILVSLASSLFTPILQDFIKLKSCHLRTKFSFEKCAELFIFSAVNESNTTDCDTFKVHSNASSWLYYYDLIQLIPCFLIVLLYASWSEHHGRKPLMIFYCVGSILATILLIVNISFLELPLSIVFFITIPNILVGWRVTLSLAVYSYISDVSDVESRTIRLSVVQAILILAETIGIFFGTYFVYEVRSIGTLILNITLYIITLIYIILRFNRKPLIIDELKEKCFCNDMVQYANLEETVVTPFKKRSNNYRLHILLLLICIFLANGAITGELFIIKIYLSSFSHFWAMGTQVVFSPFLALLGSVGLLIILPILKRIFQMEDTSLAIMGCISKIASSVLISLSTNTLMIYMSGIIGVLSLIPGVAALSLLSQFVGCDEYGKIFTIASIMMYSSPLMFTEIYRKFYFITLPIWRSFCFIGTCIIFTTVLLLFGVIHYERRSNCDTKSFQRLKVPQPHYEPDAKC